MLFTWASKGQHQCRHGVERPEGEQNAQCSADPGMTCNSLSISISPQISDVYVSSVFSSLKHLDCVSKCYCGLRTIWQECVWRLLEVRGDRKVLLKVEISAPKQKTHSNIPPSSLLYVFAAAGRRHRLQSTRLPAKQTGFSQVAAS